VSWIWAIISARHRGDEATTVVALACGVAHRGHHGRFFSGHGDEPVAAIDPHVGGNAHRDVHRADEVLDQVVGHLGRQVAGVEQVRAFGARRGLAKLRPRLSMRWARSSSL
jgi:hypothetical protein